MFCCLQANALTSYVDFLLCLLLRVTLDLRFDRWLCSITTQEGLIHFVSWSSLFTFSLPRLGHSADASAVCFSLKLS